MLPDFPGIKTRLLRLASIGYRRRINADGLIGEIAAMPYFEGRQFASGDVDGHVELSPAEVKAIPYEIQRSAIIARGPAAFAESLDAAAEIHLKELHELLFRKHSEATERVGNAVDAQGRPFSADLYFEMLEKVQIDFDASGRPETSGTRLVMHPEMAARVIPLMKQWESDESFQRRYRELMLRKRNEWRDRESNRKLVD
jgi:hypothetical protein